MFCQNITDGSGNTGAKSGTSNYTYDGNGNALTDQSRLAGNTSTTYNLLNLPLVVTLPNGTSTFTFDATGSKLRKVSVISGVTTTTDYISGIQYKNGTSTVDFIQTDEGKAVLSGANYVYYYNLADHLGNNR